MQVLGGSFAERKGFSIVRWTPSFRTDCLLIDSPIMPLGTGVSAIVNVKSGSWVRPLAKRQGLNVLGWQSSGAGGEARFLQALGVGLFHWLLMVISLIAHKLLRTSKQSLCIS
jgi:hypothetical protein